MKRTGLLLILAMLLSIATLANAATLEDAIDLASTVTPLSYTAQESENRVQRMLDNNRSTSYSYTGWSSKRTDDIPEVTFYFGGDQLSEIWIRNGNTASDAKFWANGRPGNIRLRIHRYGDSAVELVYKLDNSYTSTREGWSNGYQILALPELLQCDIDSPAVHGVS